MAEDAPRARAGAQDGVVNHNGQVYSGQWQCRDRGLYITDAAVIPPSLGVNPRLTISAQVEGTCARLARDHGQAIDYTLT